MLIYVITENYNNGTKYVCSDFDARTSHSRQVFHHKEDAEKALQGFLNEKGPLATFTYEMHELEIK